MGLDVGDRIPSFELRSHTDDVVRSADLLGKGPVVIYFYPKDETAGCTAEACAFRDQYDVFAEAGAQVVGISADDPKRHARFASRHSLPFTLLSDPGHRVMAAFGVKKTLGVVPGRVTFVVDAGGIVRHRFSSMLNATRHVTEALAVVQRLAAG